MPPSRLIGCLLGAGERMLDHALVRIHKMLGDIGQVPVATPWVPPAR